MNSISAPRTITLNAGLAGTELSAVASQWTERDCRIYALGIGAGQTDPMTELEYTTENSQGHPQQVYPTFGVIPGGRVGVRGLLNLLGDAVDVGRMLHGEQRLVLHRPLPPAASVITTGRINAIWDKGNATVIETVTATADATTGEPYCTTTQSLFFRGIGGWGGERGPAAVTTTPGRAADDRFVVQTRRDQPLLYRLSGDSNPLHSDPLAAASAGFDRPILHGLCVFGIVGRTLLTAYGAADPRRFGELAARFRRPTMPGDTLVISVWNNGPTGFEFVVERDGGEQVLSGGRFTSRGGA